MNRKQTIALGIFAGLVLLVLAAVNLRSDAPVPFDSEEWKADIESRPSMVEDLRNRFARDKTCHEEVARILGRPTTESNVVWIYDMGTRETIIGNLPDSEDLLIRFSEDGCVASSEVRYN